MPELRILLLGAPQIAIDRTAVVTDTRKATALPAYLAVADQPQRRATLATLLWPTNDEQKAEPRSAGPSPCCGRRSAPFGSRSRARWVNLGRANVRVDVAEFRRAVTDGRLEDAANRHAAIYGKT